MNSQNQQKQQETFKAKLVLIDSTSSNGSEISETENGFYFWNSTRYFILAISLICFSILWANCLVFGFTIICFNNQTLPGVENVPITKNGSLEVANGVAHYSKTDLLFAAAAVGCLSGTICLPFVSSKFGTRIVFTIYGLISGICTVLAPLAIHNSFGFIFAMRVGQGFGYAIGTPGLAAITTPWAPLSDAGIFLSLLSTQLQLGPIFSSPLAGIFCDSSIGWPGIYYLQGGITLIAFGAFFVIFRDSPRFHKNVSSKELKKIIDGRPPINIGSAKGLKTPYKEILTDKSIIGILIVATGAAVGFQVFALYGAKYLHEVVGLDVLKAGLIGALPYLCSLISKVLSGPISDRITFLSQKTKVIMFSSLSQYGMALSFILLAWMPIKSQAFALIFYILALVFSGINCVGVLKGISLSARQHSYFVLILTTFINIGVGLIFPLIIMIFAPDISPNQWPIMFYSIAILIAICVTVYNITCETEPRPWTCSNDEERTATKL